MTQGQRYATVGSRESSNSTARSVRTPTATRVEYPVGQADDIAEARKVLLTIPGFETWKGAEIRRLGGLTNRVFWVFGERAVCLRLPGRGTEEYIDRRKEEVAARAAAAAGVSPAVLFADVASGVLVTEFCGNAEPMTPAKFGLRSGAARRAGATLRRLHESDVRFTAHFDVFEMMRGYLALLRQKGAVLPQNYRDLLYESSRVEAAVRAHPVPIVACHCDPVCENFLDAGDRMLLVDWEYSGMNDPMWDLGDMSIEANFTAEQRQELVAGYFNRSPSAGELGRIVIYGAMCDLLWSLWSLIQVANENPADDFDAYGLKRFKRCRELMASEGFSAHLAAVKADAR